MKANGTLKIGELAHLFDLSVDAIRYYEKMELLTPTRDENSGYRIYTLDDIQTLMIIRELLELGFSTEQIREFVKDRNIHTTLSLIEEELHVINEKIVNLFETKNRIEHQQHTLQSALLQANNETIQVIKKPKRPCLLITDENLPDNYVDYYMMQYMKETKHKISAIGACDCYTLDLEGSNPDSDYYRTKNVFFLSDELSHTSNYFLPAGTYLSVFYQGSLKKTKQLLPKLYAYAKKQGFTVVGEPIEFCHVDGYETEKEEEYVIELEVMVQ